ncbi:VWA domain-containing protein [Spirosoma sp. KCTC 42546]|uniref:vWA domain-containing protein n=1 Tax=Spirosoma sp. KCTC 42546 TaxID=2520506 RepID=UPI00115B7E2D|nr:VWA domain-containing protein [Spirosoma sp. KCTC 42546]QDK78782.1 VWA domain-containing protein [Spirosoma sp. KCTC 42546]
MHPYLCLFLICFAYFASGQALRETPQQALNQYVAFLNQSVDEVSDRFQRVQAYYTDMSAYQARGHSQLPLRLSPSGMLEDYYYKKALTGDAFTDAEKQRLKSGAQSLWKLVNKIDQTAKALETYDRLKDYQRDNFKKANTLITDLQALTTQFSRDKDTLYKQIQRVYRRYQPYRSSDAYLYTEKEMEQVLLSQQRLLDTLSYYLNENGKSNWPVKFIQQSIVADEKLLNEFGKGKSVIEYPASDMVGSFKAGLQTIQAVKKRGVDEYTFAAQQTARHNNEFYRSFINQYNNDLLNWYQSFVKYSAATRQLLDYPKYAPVFAFDVPSAPAPTTSQTEPFRDSKPIAFTVKPATAPASAATFAALNAYVDFINESLRQMNQMQLLVRNYQSSAAYYREPGSAKRRSNLTYSHEDYNVPLSEHQLLVINTPQIPQPYRASINGQADVLLAILKEMDALSIELITYTSTKQYEQDHLKRSDAILDRYAYLFDIFDKKKEQLYQDVRRIHESYPVKKPVTPWNVSGKAMLKLVDLNKEILFGIRAYLKGEATQVPPTDALQAEARTLITDEYQNLKGLKRYGRSNGLCPYTPYEDLAENSLRLAEMAQKVAGKSASQAYETFYYFFNNEVAYPYNKFSELATMGVLKTINEPNVLAFQRSVSSTTPLLVTEKVTPPIKEPIAETKPIAQNTTTVTPISSPTTTMGKTVIRHDTVYVNQTKVDTVYIDRPGQPNVVNSLAGFAANNMVLLLDVSGSMDSPYKLPLLKKSIKSLLNIVRPEDQLSVIVYSGKAKVALKPTSGSNASEIARIIDQLQSDGDTDGNGGIRLAYKVANKNYIRAGNNRIILATDGEFPVSDEVFQLVSEASTQDVYLTIFTFGQKEVNGQNLKKLAQTGKGSYTHITKENANLQLILEAQAKRMP